MNRRGFTLVELLVAIAILGIITGISIPLIRNVQSQQKIKQFDMFKTSMLNGAKLYNDSYNVDLFGKRQSGCAIISYEDLINRKIIKDIKIKNVKCNVKNEEGNSESYVIVTKYLNNYYYYPNLVCHSGDSSDSNIVYPINEETEEITDNVCPSDGNASIDIKADPNKHTKYDVKEIKNIKVFLSSATGFSTNLSKRPKIEYLFTKNATLQTTDYDASWTAFDPFIPKSKAEQLSMIKNGEVVNANIGIINLKNMSGEIHLFVRVNNVYNLADEEWEPDNGWSEYGDYKYREIGKYKVDNTKPTVTINKLVSNISNGNGLSPKLYTTVKDNEVPNGNIKMCISVDDVNGCKASTTAEIKKKFNKNSTSPKSIKVADSYDGTTHRITVRAVDLAGNMSTTVTSDSYKVSKIVKPTITNSNNNKWTGSDYSIKVSTTTPKGIIGKWYYKYGSDNFTEYKNYTGKQTFNIAVNKESQNGTLYIKVCNTKAKNSSDTSNCSASVSTIIKLDKTGPKCVSSGGSATWKDSAGNTLYKWVANSQKITGTCTDTKSGVVTSTVSATKSISSGQSGSIKGSYSPGVCKDKVGNETTCDKVYVKVTGTTLSDYNSGALFMYDGKTGLSDTTWNDQSGNKRNVTLQAGISKSGNSIYCSGERILYNSYGRIGVLNYKTVTMETTFKPTKYTSDEQNMLNNQEHGGYALMIKTNGKARFEAYKNGDFAYAGDKSVDTNEISYIAGAANASMIKSYINGSLNYKEASGEIGYSQNNEEMILCGSPNYRNNLKKVDGWYFTGYLYSVRMYSTVLSDDQIQKHYVIDKARFN